MILVGFVLAIGVGAGTGTVLEFMDRSIRRPEELSAIIKYPVLAIVPYWETVREARAIVRKKWLMAFTVFSFMVLSVVAVHIFYMPLDIIAVKIVRKIVLKFLMDRESL